MSTTEETLMCSDQQAAIDATTSHIPLYGTQGGGYASYENGQYVWHSEIPNFLNAQVGDPIPKEWSVVSVNEAAHREVEEEAAWDEHLYGRTFCDFCGNAGCGYCFGSH
jgi:hypothetical protein